MVRQGVSKRNGESKDISGPTKAFPDESLEASLFLPTAYLSINTIDNSISIKKPSSEHQPIQIKHPNAHQLACIVNEDDGLLEIKQGRCITTLIIPPGSVGIKYSIDW